MKCGAVSGLLVGLVLALVAAPARAAEYFVAASGGSDSGECTMAAPCATVEGGQAKAAAGDTVWIRGGTYSFSGTARAVGVAFTKAGAQDKPIHYFAYEAEIPVFDLTNLTPSARVTGFDVNTSWLHIRGIEIRGVQQYMSGEDSWGLRIRGSNNVIEAMNVHHNEAPGIFITSGANNHILNCDSHHNYDVLEQGGSGDGFGCHSTGAGNVLSGCRGYANSDDGFDFINAAGACTVESSWSFNNGFIPDTMTTAGNGAGFKAGGFGSPPMNVPSPVPRHVVRQCIAFGNRSQGFYANHHPGGLDFFNNVAFRNGANYDMLTDTTSDHALHNNIAMAPGTAIRNLVGGTATFNSWTLSVTVSSADFSSVDEAEALAPRKADGSLPDVSFMHLAADSDLIDKGTDVGLPSAGSAPDLGAFESGLAAGAGGMGGGPGDGAAGTSTAGGSGGAAGTAAGGSAAAGNGSSGAAGSGSAGVPSAGVGGAAMSGAGSGAVPATGGTTGPIDTPVWMVGSKDDSADAPGCGCRVGQRHESEAPTTVASLLAFTFAAVLARRRRSRRST